MQLVSLREVPHEVLRLGVKSDGTSYVAHLRHVLLQNQLLVVCCQLVELVVQLHEEDVLLDHSHDQAAQVKGGVIVLSP